MADLVRDGGALFAALGGSDNSVTDAGCLPSYGPERLTVLEEEFVLSSLGIREPWGTAVKIVSPFKIEAVVTPGLAFDSSGRRIGFGGGYYDKLFLELPDKSLRIGVAYDFQRVESVHQDTWDNKVHRVITEKKL